LPSEAPTLDERANGHARHRRGQCRTKRPPPHASCHPEQARSPIRRAALPSFVRAAVDRSSRVALPRHRNRCRHATPLRIKGEQNHTDSSESPLNAAGIIESKPGIGRRSQRSLMFPATRSRHLDRSAVRRRHECKNKYPDHNGQACRLLFYGASGRGRHHH